MAERGAVDHTREPLSGLVERVTFHSADTGFCVLRVKVRGHRDVVTVLGSAAEVHAGEHIQASGQWQQHRAPVRRALRARIWWRQSAHAHQHLSGWPSSVARRP